MVVHNTLLQELSGQIELAELLTTALASTVVVLARAGHDAVEARQHLFEQLDALTALRRKQSLQRKFAIKIDKPAIPCAS